MHDSGSIAIQKHTTEAYTHGVCGLGPPSELLAPSFAARSARVPPTSFLRGDHDRRHGMDHSGTQRVHFLERCTLTDIEVENLRFVSSKVVFLRDHTFTHSQVHVPLSRLSMDMRSDDLLA